ncbi:hypothetical protein SAMN05518866_11824 [Sphingobium sp. YR768]|nr:hypothetical protein SAMN05518866_11824 [Sphingobium sp. YR768]
MLNFAYFPWIVTFYYVALILSESLTGWAVGSFLP